MHDVSMIAQSNLPVLSDSHQLQREMLASCVYTSYLEPTTNNDDGNKDMSKHGCVAVAC